VIKRQAFLEILRYRYRNDLVNLYNYLIGRKFSSISMTKSETTITMDNLKPIVFSVNKRGMWAIFVFN